MWVHLYYIKICTRTGRNRMPSRASLFSFWCGIAKVFLLIPFILAWRWLHGGIKPIMIDYSLYDFKSGVTFMWSHIPTHPIPHPGLPISILSINCHLVECPPWACRSLGILQGLKGGWGRSQHLSCSSMFLLAPCKYAPGNVWHRTQACVPWPYIFQKYYAEYLLRSRLCANLDNAHCVKCMLTSQLPTWNSTDCNDFKPLMKYFTKQKFVLFSPLSSFKLFLELEPQLRDIIFMFYESKYASCLKLLDELKDNLLLDMYLAPHINTLYSQIRNRALIQVGIFSYIIFSTLVIKNLKWN